MNSQEVKILTAGIGLGHTFYGQTLEDPLRQAGISFSWLEARQEAEDPISKAFWEASHTAYRQGSQGHLRNWAYEKLRARSNSKSVFLRPSQEEIRKKLADFNGVMVSTHAHTAVQTHNPLILIQGDRFGGRDYAVPEADCTVVPTQDSKDELVGFGIDPDKIEIVGFYSDNRLKQLKDRRIAQLRRKEKLHVGIYLTGARPAEHVNMIWQDLLPGLTSLMKKSHGLKTTIYTTTDHYLAYSLLIRGTVDGLKTIWYGDDASDGNWDLRVACGQTAREANEIALSILGDENNPVGLFAGMMGERTGWAPDLAMTLFPAINKTNAGGNTDWAVKNRFAQPPEDTKGLAGRIKRGDTSVYIDNMFRAGEHIFTDGAENTVKVVQKYL